MLMQAQKKPLIIVPGGEPMKVHNVITSFNEAGYERYGREFVRSFLEFWPKNTVLTVYYEGEKFDYTEGMNWHPMEEVQYLKEFLDNLRFPIMHGIVGEAYDINFDARMGRKVFMQMHAMKTFRGKVFWLDADVVTHAKVPFDFLDECLPDDAFSCYLGREGWHYTESGFLGFNGDHPIANKFYNAYVNLFIAGVNFTLPGWHDCYGFDAVREMVNQSWSFKNLAGGLPHGTMHPFVNSVLGKYMDHRKGARKESRSTQEDLVVARDEDYWLAQ